MNQQCESESSSNVQAVKKSKRYGVVVGFFLPLWLFVGIRGLLLQDIPLLLFVGLALVMFLLPFERWTRLPSRSWRTTLFCILWANAVIVLLYVLLLFVIPPFAISPQTTYLTEPRAKDFYGIDYQAAIETQLEPGVPPEKNGFRSLFETFGRSLCKKLEEQHWNRVCQELELSPKLEPKQTFTDWREYIETLPPEEQKIIGTSSRENAFFWSNEALPIVRRWLDENESALEQFAAAVQKQVLYLPPIFGEKPGIADAVLVNDAVCRLMANNIQCRVRYWLAVKETGKAWNDVLTIYRISRHHRRAVWNILSSLANIAIISSANQSAAAVLLHSDWTSEEIRRKVEEIAPYLQPFQESEFKNILRNERLTTLQFCQHLFSEDETVNPKGFWNKFKQKNAQTLLRRGYMMTEVNRLFDEREQRFFSGIAEPERKEIHTSDWLQLLAWYGKYAAIPVIIGRTAGKLHGSSFDAWRVSCRTHQADGSLLRILFALESYRRDNDGKFPDSLDALQGRYLNEVPLDPFSDKPFRYTVKPTKDGEPPNILLYSVGPNGKDEDGRNYADVPKGDDIRMKR